MPGTGPNSIRKVATRYFKTTYGQGRRTGLRMLQLVALCTILGSIGCRTEGPWNSPRGAFAYSDEEVFSKKWTNRDGGVMEVIDSAVEKSQHFGEFLIVKIGDKQTKKAFFCEIFLVTHVPVRQQVDTSRADLPTKLMPEHNANFLLGRTGLDSGTFLIGGVALKEQRRKIVFSIDQRADHQYQTQFDYSLPGKPRRVGVPWEGGILRTLTLTQDYEQNWTSWTYMGPPQVVANGAGH